MPKDIRGANPTIPHGHSYYSGMPAIVLEDHIRQGGAYYAFTNAVQRVVSSLFSFDIVTSRFQYPRSAGLDVSFSPRILKNKTVVYTVRETELRHWLKGDERPVLAKAMEVCWWIIKEGVDPEYKL